MTLRQIKQISEHHCGPAVLEMQLDALGIEVTQEEIARVAGVEDVIEEHGTRIDQLAYACSILAPQTQFWYKYNATLADISLILKRGYVVGVEWQGLFYKTEEEEEEAEDEDDDNDFGHYSIISHYDEDDEMLIVVDPYKDFAGRNRFFDAASFLRRWWDENEVYNPNLLRSEIIRDEKLLFFITPAGEFFNKELGFSLYRGADNID